MRMTTSGWLSKVTALLSTIELFLMVSVDSNSPKYDPAHVEFNLPSLFPSYLSYAVQHKLLNAVQRVLEECCYDWAANWVPETLQDQRWDCAEAVELGTWSTVLPQAFDKIRARSTSLDDSEHLYDLLIATHPIRHAAVHRLPTHAKSLEEMLNSAISLVAVLQDGSRVSKMEAVLNDFHAKRQDMEFHKNHLENQLDLELKGIQEQRAALDKEEKEAKESMVTQDLENTRTISSLFERSIDVLLSKDNGVGLEHDILEGTDAESLKADHSTRDNVEPGSDDDGELHRLEATASPDQTDDKQDRRRDSVSDSDSEHHPLDRPHLSSELDDSNVALPRMLPTRSQYGWFSRTRNGATGQDS